MKKLVAIAVVNVMLLLPYAEVGFVIIDLFILYTLCRFTLEKCKVRW